ncbi:MAG: hypothetical protein J0L69_16760 [Bacteroidetes bacterium]|nr:hypothetical protein [Bacteroidota bacterium]
MKSGSLNEIKKELQELEPNRLAELCISLAKYKKENKDYLDYLLFESHDKDGFVSQVKQEIDLLYSEINPDMNLYYAKNILRKILRITNKYIKYVGDKSVAVDLHIYYCRKLIESRLPIEKSARLVNLKTAEIKKIKTLLIALHPDLQYDYIKELEEMGIKI